MKMALKTKNKNFMSSQTEVPLSETDQQKHFLLFNVLVVELKVLRKAKNEEK